MSSPAGPVRLTVVAPVAAPYREPLFTALHAREDIALTVIYGDAGQPSWDVPTGFFRTEHAYRAVHLSSRQLPRPGRTPVMFPSGLERELAAATPEVIVASEYGPTAIRARLWAGAHDVRHLLLTECTPEIDALLPAAQLRWHGHFARNTDGAITVSSAARDRLLAFGVPPERITVALQSADLAEIRAVAAPRELGDAGAGEPLHVLTVARLVPDKNIATLLRAARQAATDLAPRPVVVDVVGDGFLRPELETLAAELGLDVRFHGHRGGRDLAELYAGADVFALLSGYEPFGVVIREAAAAGLPIVTTGVVGAVGDLALDGANAAIVTPGDVSSAAVALSRILSDASLRARMAGQSRRIDATTTDQEVGAFAAAVLGAAERRRG